MLGCEECLSAIYLLHQTRQHSSIIDLPFSAVGARNVGVDDHLIPHALSDRTLVGKPPAQLWASSEICISLALSVW
jgi:hypothetical protein